MPFSNSNVLPLNLVRYTATHRVTDSASITQQVLGVRIRAAARMIDVRVWLAGFLVEFSEFCAIFKTDNLSILVLLVYLNLVRTRVYILQY